MIRVLYIRRESFSTLHKQLENAGYFVDVCLNGRNALNLIESNNYDVIISDIVIESDKPENTDINLSFNTRDYVGCIDLLSYIKKNKLSVQTVIVTLYSDEYCLEAVKEGALWYYNKKKVNFQTIKTLLDKAVGIKNQLEREKWNSQKIEEEKERKNRLLASILPLEVIKQYDSFGQYFSRPHENTTVLFADIVEFTKKSSSLPASDLIRELKEIFEGFDKIMEINKCTRIKTIGDGYLAVCGAPEEDINHAERMLVSAISMLKGLKLLNIGNNIQWEIRIGLNSGSIVDGVIGEKCNYDIFGNTVNIAQRMESASLPMKINISKTTLYLLEGKGYKFIERGEIEVKNNLKIPMWFLDDVHIAL